MSTVDNDSDDSQLDEEIRQSANNLEGIRKRRRLIELQTQIADEGRWLQEAQERLNNAQQSVGHDASGSTSRQSPVVSKSPVISKSPLFSIAPGQDSGGAVDALIKSVLNSTGNNMTSVNSNTPTTNQMRMVNGEVKSVSTAPVRWGNDAAPGFARSEYSPYGEKESNEQNSFSTTSNHSSLSAVDTHPTCTSSSNPSHSAKSARSKFWILPGKKEDVL
ncbi:hypothetical protein PMG11_11221 [Penicillium brasilianum]|uniref:Uncharacterized protein n=1 Tax=Penicillium brasilianum TaxID=104259 RepID=A0A0F7U4R1_PENBI|nr:hypothetical protein PMG11_11221 [Penicillium brasilianum]